MIKNSINNLKEKISNKGLRKGKDTDDRNV